MNRDPKNSLFSISPLPSGPRRQSTTLVVLLSAMMAAIALGLPEAHSAEPVRLNDGASVALVGNGLGSRMLQNGYFESEVQRRHAGRRLVIRNLCDEGDTPAFRPHSGRPSPFAFPGAEKFFEISPTMDRHGSGHTGIGHAETPDQWLTRVKADVVIAFFGFNESFRGEAGLSAYRLELGAYLTHLAQQRYNGTSAPMVVLVSPIAFEDLSATAGTPDGRQENARLSSYAAAMREVATEKGVPFVDLFAPSAQWFEEDPEPLTRDGATLNDRGHARLAPFLAEAVFGAQPLSGDETAVRTAVNDKNWYWENFYKIPNGVHVFGRRHQPFGPENYPHELIKLEQMVANRDQAIWAALTGGSFDLAAADAKTHPLPEIKTNYTGGNTKNGTTRYLPAETAVTKLKVPEGYRVDVFASEQEFPDLANPVQMSFDNRGRLWVATMPSYPHFRPGDPRPNDKLLILEDTDGDGRADRQKVFADGLHLPIGFEFAPEGVYVSQSAHLVLLRDTDGDDRADPREVVLSGFDDHDTHHAISAFCADPSGAIYMAEGTFLHTAVETAYGPSYSSNGGFFRFDPRRQHLERIGRFDIPNPWGIAFDAFGQDFFAETSSPDVHWMSPSTLSVPYGEFAPLARNLIPTEHMVRPTSGLEFVSSRHFPDEVQGDLLINNTIGFLGTKQHAVAESGTGYALTFRQDLLVSSDTNFRPVDMEFAPDGSLYVIDWHNTLIGHMQHSARDPLRDRTHGRVYRITYPSRPLVQPAAVAGAPLKELLENLKLPEYRTRYRTRRELRARPADDVLAAIRGWVAALDRGDPATERHMLEALWVTWGLNRVDQPLLRSLLKAGDHRVRAAAVRVLRYQAHQMNDQADLLLAAASDPHGRVRVEALTAASWLPKARALPVVEAVGLQPLDEWIAPAQVAAATFLDGRRLQVTADHEPATTTLTGKARELFEKGEQIFRRDGHCITCHQADGKGLPAALLRSIGGTPWALGSPQRLIRLTLHGLLGPIEVNGQQFPGVVPMTPFKGLLSDEEVAAVLTYVRQSFGNQASPIMPDEVNAEREATASQSGFYLPADLLKEFPLE